MRELTEASALRQTQKKETPGTIVSEDQAARLSEGFGSHKNGRTAGVGYEGETTPAEPQTAKKQ